MLENINAIIFDWDNTLFDFKGHWERAHQKAFGEMIAQKGNLDYGSFITTYKYFDEMLWEKLLLQEINLDQLRVQRLILTLQKFEIPCSEAFAQNFFDKFFADLLANIRPVPDLLENIQALKLDFDCFILTNGKSAEQREKILKAGFIDVMPFYISEEIGFEKPDKKAFTYLLERENLSPQSTLMVGDSLTNDILPAKQLGLTTAYIGTKKTNEADFSFENISDFMAFVIDEAAKVARPDFLLK